jgi:protein involved in polysaccharide export with SLBB domain
MRSRLATFLLLLAGALPLQLPAQVPSEEQLEMLREMAPDDREELLETLGLRRGGRETGGSSDNDSRTKRDQENLDPESGFADREAMLPRRDPALQPDDTVLVDIEFIRAKPPRVEPQGEGLPPLTIPGEPAPELTDLEREQLQATITAVRARNPYMLDGEGNLTLPDFPPILLAGLTDELASRRLAAVPAFAKLDVKVTRLPVRKHGLATLKPFGYELFRSSPSTFAPVTDVPVPADYIVGPGDQLNVQLFGGQNRNLRLTVARDGRISFPELGPINVAGRTFNQVSAEIESRVQRQMIGVRASVNMGDTRSIRVLVLGEATRPGSYTISGLGTITSALFAAGGVRPIGSLRNVQLKRQGAVIRQLDLYDMLIRGDTSDDAKLLPGDVVFIPPISGTVAVDGEVRRPAIYELKGEATVGEIIGLAGGLTAEADTTRAALLRVDEQRMRVVLDVPLADTQGGLQSPLRNGDALRILRLRPTLDSGVTLEGQVFRPGSFSWRKGLRLSDIVPTIDDLRPRADAHYVLIRRELPPDRRVAVFSADLGAALHAPGSVKDIELMPRDRIVVFGLDSGRRATVESVLEELRTQSRIDRPSEVVRIDGRVKAVGEYPLEPAMRISDLLRAGGGLQDAAYGARAELTRYRVLSGSRVTELIDIDLGAILRGDVDADIRLQPFDFLSVKELPEWSEQEQVSLQGEVRFPGRYPIRRGETLKSVLERAGGLTSLAFPGGTVFTREELKIREQEQVDRLVSRLQSDLASAALQGAQANQGQATQALAVGQSLLDQLRNSRAVGRLVIDLQGIERAELGSAQDVTLRDGDLLIIPKIKQEVTVLGEVQNATSHLFRADLTRDDYIGLSGGATRKADKRRIYVVRADGSVVSGEGSAWFRRSAQVTMRPGDTVVIPLDTERMPQLPLWQAVTQIIYNLAIAAAAVNSF